MKVKVWNYGKFVEINESTEFFVGRCGSGRTVFGERARLVKVLAKNLVFETESGAIVKTEYDTLNTVGKADKAGYRVSIGDRSGDENVIVNPVTYWNAKKLCFENR